MKPDGALKLAGGVRDLPLTDRDGARCGIADDIEFEGQPGEALRVKAILVGPGAWRGRLPGWALWLTRRVAGNRLVRVPWRVVADIGGAVRLNATARELGLMKDEDRFARWIPKKGAL